MGCIGVSVFQIELNCVVEQDTTLGNHAYKSPELVLLAFFQILAVNKHTSLLGVVHSKYQMKDSRFSEA